MGKYSLGKVNVIVDRRLSKDRLFINEDKTKSTEKRIGKELENVSTSLGAINNLLNRSVKEGLVKGMRAKAFKSWAKKAKSQSNNAIKVKNDLHEKYSEDITRFPIQELDDRIAELEKELEELTKAEVK